jgi:hypothetical protein
MCEVQESLLGQAPRERQQEKRQVTMNKTEILIGYSVEWTWPDGKVRRERHVFDKRSNARHFAQDTLEVLGSEDGTRYRIVQADKLRVFQKALRSKRNGK